ncbi:MAG TPA: peptidase, partial [Gammaproteobacteria bacterium]
MTYCVGITVNRGLVLASDSRTNAGVDQISAFSKMHRFLGDGERAFVLLSAGNLATTQAVVTRLNRDLEDNASASLRSVKHLSAAAEY